MLPSPPLLPLVSGIYFVSSCRGFLIHRLARHTSFYLGISARISFALSHTMQHFPSFFFQTLQTPPKTSSPPYTSISMSVFIHELEQSRTSYFCPVSVAFLELPSHAAGGTVSLFS
ncbi:hypothetical protein K504DRAFT_235287 [Pleomassaria siparia CBS 279.74]|uniref:Uncharacterized protein n=1 Tax=Pleomassaria siparia CBS 279.74 TaxID=1314801 RepID=A0A6G1KE95_9PLEO|nr:hypothetical protein K504DRAFT_235287 [Pleomassaria siparia CBS 279.74]